MKIDHFFASLLTILLLTISWKGIYNKSNGDRVIEKVGTLQAMVSDRDGTVQLAVVDLEGVPSVSLSKSKEGIYVTECISIANSEGVRIVWSDFDSDGRFDRFVKLGPSRPILCSIRVELVWVEAKFEEGHAIVNGSERRVFNPVVGEWEQPKH